MNSLLSVSGLIVSLILICGTFNYFNPMVCEQYIISKTTNMISSDLGESMYEMFNCANQEWVNKSIGEYWERQTIERSEQQRRAEEERIKEELRWNNLTKEEQAVELESKRWASLTPEQKWCEENNETLKETYEIGADKMVKCTNNTYVFNKKPEPQIIEKEVVRNSPSMFFPGFIFGYLIGGS